MIRVKDGVSLDRLDSELWSIVPALADCFMAHGCPDFWLTSGSEATTVHRGQPIAGESEDPHYTGHALDARIHDCPESLRAVVVEEIAGMLDCPEHHVSEDDALVYTGPLFVVRWEARGTPNEHLHLQRGRTA